jgi:hypothetical protein
MLFTSCQKSDVRVRSTFTNTVRNAEPLKQKTIKIE